MRRSLLFVMSLVVLCACRQGRMVGLVGKCSAGDGQACWDVAMIYDNGDGVPKDLAKAWPYLEKACRANHLRGCHEAALWLEYGAGVVEDRARAAEMFGETCERGYSKACAYAGDLYERGEYLAGGGAPRDLEKAERFYRKGCDAGEAFSCTSLQHLLRRQ